MTTLPAADEFECTKMPARDPLSHSKLELSPKEAAVGIAEITPGGEWTRFNDGLCQLTGYTRDELARMQPVDLVHPDDRASFAQLCENTAGGGLGLPRLTIRVLSGDDRPATVEVTASLMGQGSDDARAGLILLFHAHPERPISPIPQPDSGVPVPDSIRCEHDRFQLVAEAAQVGIWFCDLPFDVLTWDARVKEHFWFPPEAQVTIDSFYARLHPEDRERTRLAIESSIARQSQYDIEYRTVSDAGEIKWIRAIGRGFYDQQGNPTRFDGVTLDVTAMKKAEHALQESRERLQASLDAAEAGTFRWDIQRNSLEWDENLDALFGLSPGQSVRSLENFISMVHPEERAGVIERCRRCAEEGADFHMEFRVIWPDGSIHWLNDKGKTFFDAQGRPHYMTGACVEITTQKHTEAALRESSERFRAMADHISQLAWMAEADGHIFWYNRRWFEYTGTTLDAVQGSGWVKLYHPDHLERVLENWWRQIRAGQTWEDTFPILGADGDYRWFLSRAIPIKGLDGRVQRWFGTHTDITDQRESVSEPASLQT